MPTLLAGDAGLPADTTIATIRRVYAAFGRGDALALLESFTEDASFESVGDPALLPYCGTWRGQEGLADFFLALVMTAEVLAFVPEEISECGPGRVLGRGATHLRFRTTGVEVWSRWVHLFHLAGGRVVAGTEWSDTAAQLLGHLGAAREV